MLINQNSQDNCENIERSMIKTVLIRILCFTFCFILIWLGYGAFKNYVEKTNDIEGIEWEIPLSREFDYESKEAYIMKKNLEEIGLGLVTRQEKVKSGISSYYETYFGVKDKNGKVIIKPKYDYLTIDKEGHYILASYYSSDENAYADLKNVVHYYNFDGSDYVRGNYCEGEFFQDGYAVVGVPWEKSENIYFKKKVLVINQNSEVVYDSPYNKVSYIPGLKDCFVVYNENFGNGLGMPADDKKGIININGEILVPLEYYSIECNKEQQIIYLTKLDEKGNEILYCMDYRFNSIPVDEMWKFRANHSFEYMNPISKDVVYNADETMPKEELFRNARTVDQDEKGWHIVDGNKEIIANFTGCIKMYDFSEGISVVEYKDKIKYVDTSGKVLFETKKVEGCDLEEYGGNCFFDGTIEFAEYKSSFLGNDYKVGLLDKTGKVLLPAEFDHISTISGNGRIQQAIVRKYGSYGVVNVKL